MNKTLADIKPRTLFPIQTMNNPNIPLIHRIEMLEQYMLKMPQVECPVKEFFGDGLYAREVFMPAGTFAIGGIHNFDHISVMVSGELYMWTEDDGLVHLQGYNPVRAKSGVKRVGYIIQDVTWFSVHKVGDGVSQENVTDYLIASSYEDYKSYKQEKIDVLSATV